MLAIIGIENDISTELENKLEIIYTSTVTKAQNTSKIIDIELENVQEEVDEIESQINDLFRT